MQDTGTNPSGNGNKGRITKRKVSVGLLLVSAAALLSLAFVLHQPKNPAPAPYAADDAAIFSFLLSKEAPSGSKMVVIENETVPWSIPQSMLNAWQSPKKASSVEQVKALLHIKKGGSFDSKLVTELALRNAKPKAQSLFPSPHRLRLVSEAAIDAIFKKGWWPQFYKAYPGSCGVASFSLPAYSSNGLEALAYATFASGGKSGSGMFYYLEKKNKVWKVKASGGWAS